MHSAKRQQAILGRKGTIMSYPSYMTDEELKVYGFVIDPEKPTTAYSELYPNFSFRHRCETCGIWSAVFGGTIMECPRCYQGKEPFKVTLQSYKLYVCCFDPECAIRKAAMPILWEADIDAKWPSHDGYGEYYNLASLKTASKEKQECFFMSIRNLCVSKFRAMKLTHPGKKERSKLPKTMRT
jgi:hypothetical protein